jgi:hypothetical protein
MGVLGAAAARRVRPGLTKRSVGVLGAADGAEALAVGVLAAAAAAVGVRTALGLCFARIMCEDQGGSWNGLWGLH